MRVAFAGTHRTGKTTLLEAVSTQLRGYTLVDEPYRVLEDEGYDFSDPPGTEDFERQLRQSLTAIATSGQRTLFDRCPLDLVAYLQELDGELELDDWLDDLRAGMETLDMVVLLSIETPDRVPIESREDKWLRQRVDERLRALVLDDPYEFDMMTVEVFGDIDARVRQVMHAMR
jgi:predicted ATPase